MFKDAVARDIDHVFLNLNEFAETHFFAGQEVVVVVNDDSQAKVKKGFLLGIVEADVILYGKTENLPPQRGIGKTVDYDGKVMQVTDWATAAGVTEIALRQNVQR